MLGKVAVEIKAQMRDFREPECAILEGDGVPQKCEKLAYGQSFG
jgi:hypothetical protein